MTTLTDQHWCLFLRNNFEAEVWIHGWWSVERGGDTDRRINTSWTRVLGSCSPARKKQWENTLTLVSAGISFPEKRSMKGGGAKLESWPITEGWNLLNRGRHGCIFQHRKIAQNKSAALSSKNHCLSHISQAFVSFLSRSQIILTHSAADRKSGWMENLKSKNCASQWWLCFNLYGGHGRLHVTSIWEFIPYGCLSLLYATDMSYS